MALGEENYGERGRGATDSRKDRLSTVKAQLWASFNYQPVLHAEFKMPPPLFYSISGNIKEIYLVD